MDEQTWVLIVSGSVLLNAVVFVFVFFTGIGQRVWKRWRARMLYRSGRYVNTLFTYNTGVAAELFIKKEDDGSFKVGDARYAINRQMNILLDGIPTQRNIEGIAEPIPWDSTVLGDYMSTSELEQIITNNLTDNLAKALREWKMIGLIFVIVVVIAVGASLYFNWQIFDALVQGGYQPKAIIPSRVG